MIDLADLPSDWAVWSIDQPVERREFYDWLGEMTAPPLPVASSAPPKRRERKPSLESQVRQLFRAARAAGVSIAVTIEGADGAKLTVTPAGRSAASEPAPDEAPRRSLFTNRAVPKQKVVL